jgi:nucleotide-binding universal stress UspA family protein
MFSDLNQEKRMKKDDSNPTSPHEAHVLKNPGDAPAKKLRPQDCKRVLVALDLNKRHGFALPYAYGMVKPGGTVILVHVMQPFRLPNPMIGGYYQELPTKKQCLQQASQMKERMLALVPEEAGVRGISTEVEIIEGTDPAASISEAADRLNVDVVCIGAHARPGFIAKVMGSVALGVLTKCNKAVLVVWPPNEE